ncbi:MAG TPA: protein kinase [Dehalococcoidia bacterium]|nr:protein kinase [Dehalococcoidia bacterium]
MPESIGSFSLPALNENADSIYRSLAHGRRLIRFDGRGVGLSDREASDMSHQAHVRDLQAVLMSVEQPISVFADGLVGPAAIECVARHPSLVHKLVLYGTCARLSDVFPRPLVEGLANMALTNYDMAIQMITLVDPQERRDSPEVENLHVDLVRRSMSAEAFSKYLLDGYDSDATSSLGAISVPTLVVHRLDDPLIPFEEGRKLHAAIPGARLVQLQGASHQTYVGDWKALVEAINGFLDDGSGTLRDPAESGIEVAGGRSGGSHDEVTIAGSTTAQPAFAEGRYLVRRLLGGGGQKTVYLVHDQLLDRQCALSILRTTALGSESIERFQREARAMAGIGTHPNIVTVFDFGDDQGRPYLVCEYVAGGDLRSELGKAGGALPVARVLAIARDVATGLAAAHQRGVVHRDLKPDNIWIDVAGHAKIGDFGIASMEDWATLTAVGGMVGTPAYMSPEQASGSDVDARSDLYSLGAMLYEMTTGRPPFTGDSALAVASQHVNVAPEPPSMHNPALSAALDSIVLRLLAKEPGERPKSAAAARDELRAAEGE